MLSFSLTPLHMLIAYIGQQFTAKLTACYNTAWRTTTAMIITCNSDITVYLMKASLSLPVKHVEDDLQKSGAPQ